MNWEKEIASSLTHNMPAMMWMLPPRGGEKQGRGYENPVHESLQGEGGEALSSLPVSLGGPVGVASASPRKKKKNSTLNIKNKGKTKRRKVKRRTSSGRGKNNHPRLLSKVVSQRESSVARKRAHEESLIKRVPLKRTRGEEGTLAPTLQRHGGGGTTLNREQCFAYGTNHSKTPVRSVGTLAPTARQEKCSVRKDWEYIWTVMTFFRRKVYAFLKLAHDLSTKRKGDR